MSNHHSNQTRKQILAAVGTIAMTGASLTSAIAHEQRYVPASVGKIHTSVGFHNEPAFTDGTVNAIDLILASFDGLCSTVGGTDPTENLQEKVDATYQSTGGGDTISLQTEVLILDQEKPYFQGKSGNPKILARKTITDISPLQDAYFDAGRYNSWFIPTQPAGGPAVGASWHS